MAENRLSEADIESIVAAVISELSPSAGSSGSHAAPIKQLDYSRHPNISTSSSRKRTEGDGVLPDLGDDAVGRVTGVPNPKNPDVLQDFVASSRSRVASGRAGARPRTMALMRFWADHSRSKDTVLKNVPQEWVDKSGLLELRTEIIDKDQFLTRPDLGRRLAQESVEIVQKECIQNPEVQLIVSDGLSTDAIVVNFEEIIPPLLRGLEKSGMKLGTPVFVRHGRVKVQDHLGELLGADVMILLIGERPGLGQSESLSCYMVYRPTVADTVESDRICVSNIHAGGTPPVEAAAVIVDLARKMLSEGKGQQG